MCIRDQLLTVVNLIPFKSLELNTDTAREHFPRAGAGTESSQDSGMSPQDSGMSKAQRMASLGGEGAPRSVRQVQGGPRETGRGLGDPRYGLGRGSRERRPLTRSEVSLSLLPASDLSFHPVR